VGFECEFVEFKETQNTEWEASQVCVGVNELKDRLSQKKQFLSCPSISDMRSVGMYTIIPPSDVAMFTYV
jgi:hypothetical protein